MARDDWQPKMLVTSNVEKLYDGEYINIIKPYPEGGSHSESEILFEKEFQFDSQVYTDLTDDYVLRVYASGEITVHRTSPS